MRDINLSNDLLNSNKILFHYGKMLEDIKNGKEEFNPIAIEIHPTARCNHRCIHCSYKERNESRATISKSVMDKLIKSIINMGIRAVYFSGGGEPTLYPDLKEYIVELVSHGIECSVITNGSCFEKMGIIQIADKLNYIAVSVPDIDVEGFRLITGTNNLNEILELPGKIKKLHKDKSPIVGSRIVLTNKNYMKVKKFLEVMKERKFDYALFKVVRDYEDNGQGLGLEEEKVLKQEIQDCSNFDKKFTNLHMIFNYRAVPEFLNKCWVNQYGLLANVGTDGRVYPNIVEIDNPEFCIGNLYEKTLEEMWNSERHKQVKKKSNEKWLAGKCINCRAISYNQIINKVNHDLPIYFDSFL